MKFLSRAIWPVYSGTKLFHALLESSSFLVCFTVYVMLQLRINLSTARLFNASPHAFTPRHNHTIKSKIFNLFPFDCFLRCWPWQSAKNKGKPRSMFKQKLFLVYTYQQILWQTMCCPQYLESLHHVQYIWKKKLQMYLKSAVNMPKRILFCWSH